MQADLSLRASSRWKPWLALATAGLLALAGCGGGGSDGTGSSREPAVQAGAEPATTLYRASFIGEFPNSARGRALNASGQVAGHVGLISQPGTGFFHDGTRLLKFDTPSGNAPEVLDLNDAGQVVGSFRSTGDEPEAFSWTRAGGLERIAPLSAKVRSSVAHDVNAAGQVAGTLVRYDGSSQGFLWSRSTGLVTAFGAANTALVAAYRINDSGLIAGEAMSEGERRPVLVDAATGALTFVAPPGWGSVESGTLRRGLLLNNAGDVAGTLGTRDEFGSPRTRAFFSQPLSGGGFTDLDAVVREGLSRERPVFDWDESTYVTALNEKGQVIVNIALGVRSHFWSRATGFVGIWPTGSDDYSLLSLNRHGAAVGWSDPEFGIAWSRNAGAVDLNSRVSGLPPFTRVYAAEAINDRGQILGWAFNVLGEGSAPVLLTPIEGSAP